MKLEPWRCSCNFMVSFYAIFRYSGFCSAFGLEVPMNKKHLTYDDRLAIQAGLQKGLKVAQIAKNIGKDRRPSAGRLKPTEGWYPVPMATTVSAIRPVPESRTAAQDATGESASARLPAEDARRTARSTGRSSVLIMRDPPLSAIPVTTGPAADSAVCSMMRSMPRSNTRRPFQSHAEESP